jgi:hypothetical protein
MTQIEHDANLMLVAAVEEYSLKYCLTPRDTLALFIRENIHSLIRKHYAALHTQSLDESFYFAEDILARNPK